jgi:hypothetical protein
MHIVRERYPKLTFFLKKRKKEGRKETVGKQARV